MVKKKLSATTIQICVIMTQTFQNGTALYNVLYNKLKDIFQGWVVWVQAGWVRCVRLGGVGRTSIHRK